MADFTYLLMQWTMPGLVNADLKALNIPSMEEAAQIYCDVTGSAVPDLNWYFSYNLFRLAGITQGIAGRIRDGTAASAKAMESAKRTVPLAKGAWEYTGKAGAVEGLSVATVLCERHVVARESGRATFSSNPRPLCPGRDIDRQTSGNLPMPVLPLDKVQQLHTRIGVADITSIAHTFNPN